jgi:hypothetical protein
MLAFLNRTLVTVAKVRASTLFCELLIFDKLFYSSTSESLVLIITGICALCGKFQKHEKFKRSDKRDNAAWNFVLCDACRKRREKMPRIRP